MSDSFILKQFLVGFHACKNPFRGYFWFKSMYKHRTTTTWCLKTVMYLLHILMVFWHKTHWLYVFKLGEFSSNVLFMWNAAYQDWITTRYTLKTLLKAVKEKKGVYFMVIFMVGRIFGVRKFFSQKWVPSRVFWCQESIAHIEKS